MCFFKGFRIRRIHKRLKALNHARKHDQVSSSELKKERVLYHKLASIYESLKGKKKYPFAQQMALECYRAAGNIEDAQALYLLGKYLLEEARFREDLEKEQIFASSNNEKRMKLSYNEGLMYLLSAERLGHVHAKRLHGLCYINGWGVEPDKKAGFELVVASIEQENSWDKVPQIFADIGLNKPEFYSALTEFRKKV